MKSLSSARRGWRAAGAAVTAAALLAGVAAAPGSPAHAQGTGDPCPAPFPVGDLAAGMVASGLTVERGTTPEPFSATIVGVIEDGIAPGLDMIIADTSSPAIDRVGGIWAGMSGSPVYAPDGRLIGAVAYGLSASPSPIAGITPAADMMQVLDRPSAAVAAEAAEEVPLPAAIRSRLVSTDAATTAEAAAGMRRLPLPVVVSGLSERRLDQVSERLAGRIPDARLMAGASADAGTGSPADIIPGGNFAGSVSFGDASLTGVGTTTVVCDGRALAFGHPFLHSGVATLSTHTATAVFVQPDLLLPPFKVANVGGVVGTIDQDRLAGIRAVLGTAPATVPITSTIISRDGGTSRDGTTQVSEPGFIPDAADFHLLSNLDRVLDKVGSGSTLVRWRIEGTRSSGAPFQLDVTNRYADQFDVSIESLFDSTGQLIALVNNPFERVRITGVRYDGEVSGQFQRYTIDSVLVQRRDGSYGPVPDGDPLPVVTGGRLNLRVMLNPFQNAGPQASVDLAVTVPSGMAGATGTLNVIGGPSFDEGEEPATFDELLAQLRGLVPNHAVSATLNLERETADDIVTRQTRGRGFADSVVSGETGFDVRVVAAPDSLPGVTNGEAWRLRSSLSSGDPTTTFRFGGSIWQPLACDTNGDGRAEPVVFRSGVWRFKSAMTATAERSFTFGVAGDIAVCGDWNGDGRDDAGVYRNGRWILRAGFESGPGGWDFTFGTADTRPVVGDWDGNGTDTVGLFQLGGWQLRNNLSAGSPSATFTFGGSGDQPLAGDWNGDGRDTPGLFRGGTWLVRNTLASGSATSFTFGTSTSRPVVWHR